MCILILILSSYFVIDLFVIRMHLSSWIHCFLIICFYVCICKINSLFSWFMFKTTALFLSLLEADTVRWKLCKYFMCYQGPFECFLWAVQSQLLNAIPFKSLKGALLPFNRLKWISCFLFTPYLNSVPKAWI